MLMLALRPISTATYSGNGVCSYPMPRPEHGPQIVWLLLHTGPSESVRGELNGAIYSTDIINNGPMLPYGLIGSRQLPHVACGMIMCIRHVSHWSLGKPRRRRILLFHLCELWLLGDHLEKDLLWGYCSGVIDHLASPNSGDSDHRRRTMSLDDPATSSAETDSCRPEPSGCHVKMYM